MTFNKGETQHSLNPIFEVPTLRELGVQKFITDYLQHNSEDGLDIECSVKVSFQHAEGSYGIFRVINFTCWRFQERLL